MHVSIYTARLVHKNFTLVRKYSIFSLLDIIRVFNFVRTTIKHITKGSLKKANLQQNSILNKKLSNVNRLI